MEKQGYFFTLDSFLAVSVIIVGLFVIFSYRTYIPDPDQTSMYAQQIGGILGANPLYELNNQYLDNLRSDGNITQSDNSLLEQIGEFYYRNLTKGCLFCLGLANQSVQNISKGLIDPKYGFRVVLENNTVYESDQNELDSELVVSNKRIVFGVYNGTESWGPYAAEVRVWRTVGD